MKLGELFIQLGVKGDTKELDKTIKQMEEAEKRSNALVKYRKDLAKATNENEKALVKKNFADKIQLENLKKQQTAVQKNTSGWIGLAKGVLGFVAAAGVAYKATERMVTSLAQANQQMINFQRTTGISFASLNKYASANAAVNFNSSIEGTAQTMSRLANNLWDIRMGRGDISPYQELAFVGGKAFNPMGMSVEQLIESVREAIKGVDDLQATNIIQRMGFAPDDLLMLRMSREEFEKINDLFLSPKQREEMNKYGLELKKINLAFQKTSQSLIIDIAKPFLAISRIIERLWNGIYKTVIKPTVLGFKIIYNSIKGVVQFTQDLTRSLVKTFEILKPILAIFRGIYLIFEDIATYFAGGDSVLGDFIEGISNAVDQVSSFLSNIKPPEWANRLLSWFGMNNESVQPNANGEYMSTWADKPANMSPINTNHLGYTNNISTNNNFAISTQQPIDKVASNLINTFTPAQVQFSTASA